MKIDLIDFSEFEMWKSVCDDHKGQGHPIADWKIDLPEPEEQWGGDVDQRVFFDTH